MLVHMTDNYDTQLRNLWRSLAMALDAADQAQNDYNSIRLKAGMAPFQAFHLSAAVPVEPRPGPRAVVRLSAVEREETSELIILSGMVRRGQAIDLAAARKLLAEKDKRR